MNTQNKYTPEQTMIVRLIASELVFNCYKNQLGEIQQIAGTFFHNDKDNAKEIYVTSHPCLEVAFDLSLNETERQEAEESDYLWNLFFDLYCSVEESFTWDDLTRKTKNFNNDLVAEKFVDAWYLLLLGHRSSKKINSYETTH